jgi:hypothetical protein
MVASVATTASGLFLDVVRLRGMQSMHEGRLSVPVNPAYSPYARFEHVRGVPASEGGVPIFKLRVLDKLIDRLLGYGQTVSPAEDLGSLRPEALEPVVYRLQQQLHRHVLNRTSAFGGQFPETGMLVDLVA